MITLHKSSIVSDTNDKLKYDLIFVKWNDEESPREIICSCKGYQYRETCKHFHRYDPKESDMWKNAKIM